MPNTILLNNNTEFTLVANGYVKDTARNLIYFRFASDLDIGSVQAVFKDEDATSDIKYILPDGTVAEEITSCTGYQGISQDALGNYTVTLSTDKDLLQKRVAELKASLSATNEELKSSKAEADSCKKFLCIIDGALWDLILDYIPKISAESEIEPEPEPEPDPNTDSESDIE